MSSPFWYILKSLESPPINLNGFVPNGDTLIEKVSDKVELDKLRDYSELKQEEEECIACQG